MYPEETTTVKKEATAETETKAESEGGVRRSAEYYH
jgi:hypothetical protein